ncbi:MAG: LuxR C-terminal-related transcriptional regulator [Oceanicaulis sp.]
MALQQPADFHTLLTERERESVGLVAQGYSAREIAERFKISPRSVDAIIDRARLKLNARNRPHMVALAVRAGLVDPAVD